MRRSRRSKRSPSSGTASITGRSTNGFVLFATTLLDNHYPTEGYLRVGENLGTIMQRIHGSVAKLANDVLPRRHLSFWREAGRRDYFDGCIRDAKQCTRAYRYILLQSVRAGICVDWHAYPHTRVGVPLEKALARSLDLHAFMEGVNYKRYRRRRRD